MDENESTKNGPEQSPSQAAGAGPDVMQQEPARKCKICGGPNHHGCGCEARQRRAAVQVETENIKSAEKKVMSNEDIEKGIAKGLGLGGRPIKIINDKPEPDEALEDILSPESIRRSQEANMTMAKNIQTMSDCFESLLTSCYDINNYLKLITGDLITIRKHLTKEDEVKNAPENKD